MTYEEALRKAVACLKLAERGGTPEEAAAAAGKAQEIIEHYKLDISSVNYDDQEKARDEEPVQDFGYEDPLEDVTNLKAWMLKLATYVSRANQCRILYVRIDRGAKIKVLGRPSDVQTVRYMHAYLRGEVVRISNEKCAGNSGTFKRQFRLGMVETIGFRLLQATKNVAQEIVTQNSMALVKVQNALSNMKRRDSEVEEFTQAIVKGFLKPGQKLRFSKVGGAGTATGATARILGRKAGEEVRMTKAKAGLGSGTKEIE